MAKVRFLGPVFWLLLLACAARGQPPSVFAGRTEDPPEWLNALGTPQVSSSLAPGIQYQHLVLSSPRSVRLHVFRVDPLEPSVEIAAAITEDPDGDGPAEAVLTDPLTMAQRCGFWVAINANAFGLIEPLPPDQKPSWNEGEPVRICGWVTVDGKLRCPPEKDYASFWVDSDRRAHCAITPPPSAVKAAVSGFGLLVYEGRVVPPPEKAPELHPRTAVGVDAKGHVVLLVADGRQAGYSEGLTCRETAWVLWALGCKEALNLDGGGSTIAVARRANGDYAAVNQPSGRTALGFVKIRPIPVLLGVRPSSEGR